MEFATVTEALTVLKNTDGDNFRWIAAIYYLLNEAPSEARADMAEKFNTMPVEQQSLIQSMLDIYQVTKKAAQ
ncbi:hypothetical protein [Beggiatoa leptomitoformis]|uniref:Uncharacterized protein n=1 Tax=Beggiatoa leptomitoformis TaxID=288004 RepID=A0A2N9YDI7_9GAMM|nr:hypothetical protein [Beggiatoa leptomitoformis]ALG69037.1 hypothetical protein AL038_16780 [Beggiatoa leptomitoformis]AUI68558.1 hypothetical protein BLE401_07460 [Beggiatoa leptomitoformis]